MLSPIIAHETGGLAGEGIPVPALYAAVVVGALIGAVGLSARGVRPLGEAAVAAGTVDGAEAGPWPGDALPAPRRIAGQVIGVSALVLVLALGWLGSDVLGLNPLVILVASVIWWAVPALSWALGDWWRVIDPFDALAGVIDRLRTRRQLEARPTTATEAVTTATTAAATTSATMTATTATAVPTGTATTTAIDADPDERDEVDESTDWWVPALLLASFAWLVTCWPDGIRPRTLAAWLTVLTVVMVGGAAVAGRSWVRRSSPLAVLCGAAAAASPVSWDDGRIRLRSPVRGLAARAGGRRTLGVLVVVLGATVWEAVAGTQWWAELTGVGAGAVTTLWSTVGLGWAILLVGLAWALTARLAEVVATRAGGAALHEPLAADLAACLAPMAVVAPLVHQLSALLIDGQTLWALASDPFGRGWDLFGTVDHRTVDAPLSPGVQAWLQIGLVGVALAVMLASSWDRLAARVGRAVSVAGWVLAGWTAGSGCLALWLLVGA